MESAAAEVDLRVAPKLAPDQIGVDEQDASESGYGREPFRSKTFP